MGKRSATAVTGGDQQGKDTNPKDVIAGAKVPLALCSPVAEAEWSLAQYAGLTKYGAWNWRIAGVRASVYVSALKRHIAGWISGEDFDPIDGTKHLGNIMACAAILLDAEAAGKLTDDRPPSVDIRKAYARIEAQMKILQERNKDKAPRHYTIADTIRPSLMEESNGQARVAHDCRHGDAGIPRDIRGSRIRKHR